MKFRYIAMGIVLLLDIFLVPWLFQIPYLLSRFGKEFPSHFFDLIVTQPFYAISQIFEDNQIRHLWLWTQLIVLGVILWIQFKGTELEAFRSSGANGKPTAAGNGQFGTSRWQTQKEIDRNTTVWYTSKPIERAGTVLGMVKKKSGVCKVYLDTDDTHKLIIGTTRSGKSSSLVLPSIWEIAHAGESMLLTDPKGELYAKTHNYLRDKGYDVVLLDFRDPGRGNHWNPMEMVIRAVEKDDIALASDAAWDIASMVTKRSSNGEQIWADGQESTIASLILAIAMESPIRAAKHITSVYHTLTELGEPALNDDGEMIIPLIEYLRSLPTEHLARTAFGTARLAPYRTRGSFFTGAAAAFRLFSDPSIAYLTSSQDHDLADIGRRKTAVFLVIPDEKKTRHILASLYVDQTYLSLVQLANQNKSRLPVRVHMLLDEFGNMPAISGFDNKITVSAGRGILYNLIVQDLNQLKTLYGDYSKTITGNCHTWIYLLSTDLDTLKVISEKTGRYTVSTESTSASVQLRNDSNSYSRSNSITGRPLLMPDEIERWERGKGLILRARHYPAILPLPDIKEWPANSDFIEEEDYEKRKIKSVPIWIPGRPILNDESLREKRKKANVFQEELEEDSV